MAGVVIVGGGFAGLHAAKALAGAQARVTLIDRNNHHLFQPLLYQVATGALSSGHIAAPIRHMLHRQANLEVLMAEITGIDAQRKKIILSNREIDYDYCVLAAGARSHYFGNEHWRPFAPSLKSIEDAQEIRRRIYWAFEAAEQCRDEEQRRAWMTFVVVGGGPTGAELSGALGEVAHYALKKDFRRISPGSARIILAEGSDRVLRQFPEKLSKKACEALKKLGVEIRCGTRVEEVSEEGVRLASQGREEFIPARTVIWAAGIRASRLGRTLAESAGAEQDPMGRLKVAPDLSLPGHPEIFVAGDMAHFEDPKKGVLPSLAVVANQQGHHAGKNLRALLEGRPTTPFTYFDKGSLAVIGRNAAVCDLRGLSFGGWPAWFTWAFVHIYYLMDFEERMAVFMEWAWNYFTRQRADRLITGGLPYLPAKEKDRPKP